MKNLEQIRAAAALKAAETKENNKPKFTRSDVAGFPALIIANGILAAFAYACEEDKETRKGIRFACDKTAEHLAASVHGIDVLQNVATGKALIEKLGGNQAASSDLQRATAEALAFFGYLKRFAHKDQP